MCRNRDELKFDQYFVQGEKLYTEHCANCHQPNGKGLGRIYPPLDKSDYMQNNFEKVLCIIRYGKKGEMVVNGNVYNQPMPSNATLTDLEIAEIATYIYNSWSHNSGIVDVSETTRILENCQGD